MQVGETVEAQYIPLEDEEQLTEAPVAALQDNGNNNNNNSDKHTVDMILLLTKPTNSFFKVFPPQIIMGRAM